MSLTLPPSVRQRLLRASLGMAAVCASMGAAAQASGYRACMISSTIEIMGAPGNVTDCLQATPELRRSAIKDRCEGLAWHAAAGMGRDRESVLTWLPQCPRREADAVCKGAFEGDFDIYYYDRNDGQLDAMAEQCDAEGGTWQALD